MRKCTQTDKEDLYRSFYVDLLVNSIQPRGGLTMLAMNSNKRKRQPIGKLGRRNGNHDWLLANASAGVSC